MTIDDTMDNATNVTLSASELQMRKDFEGVLFLYPITLHYLFPIVQFCRVIHVVWYIIGCLGNVMSMKIWSIPRMKRTNSSALYLISVTVCDISYQALHVFWYIKYFWGLPALGHDGLCEIWNTLNMIPQYASQLLVLGFSVERFISIFKPFRGERFRKRQTAPREIIAIVIVVTALSVPQAYFWKVNSDGFCEIRQGDNVMEVYLVWSVVTESIVFLFVPFVTLCLNIFVIRQAQKFINERERNSSSENKGIVTCESRVHRAGKRYRPSTITLMCISVFRIFTQLPVSITYTMQSFDKFDIGKLMPIKDMKHDAQWLTFLQYWGCRMIIEAIGASHHALSVFIFYASTKQFRLEMTRLVCSIKHMLMRKKKGSFHMNELKYGLRSSITAINTNNTLL